MVSLRTEQYTVQQQNQLREVRHNMRNHLTAMSIATKILERNLSEDSIATLKVLKAGLREIEDLVNNIK